MGAGGREQVLGILKEPVVSNFWQFEVYREYMKIEKEHGPQGEGKCSLVPTP